jgi:hypothetical protein
MVIHSVADPDPNLDPNPDPWDPYVFGPPGSGSGSERFGSADPDPDPQQNVMDPQHWIRYTYYISTYNCLPKLNIEV